jgi:hypothetical protein
VALDRDRLRKFLGMLGSDADNIVLKAGREADALVRKSGSSWEDVLQPFDELQTAIEAARHLLHENEGLKRAAANGSALATVVDWMPVGEDPKGKAQWMLDQYAAGQLHLNGFELEFLGSIAGQTRPMTERQEVVFWRIWGSVMARLQRRSP